MTAARTRTLLIEITAMAIAGVVLALFGPFGTFEHGPLAGRLVYWGGLAMTGYCFYRPATLIAEAMARRLALPLPAMIAAAIILTTFPMTLVVGLANRWAVREPFPAGDDYLVLYAQVALVAILLVLIFLWIDRNAAVESGDRAAAPGPPPAAASGPALLARLPGSFGGEIFALEMEDHYVRVHGAAGSTMLLMRLRDAIGEMEGVEGAQVHRSWWVARHAVAGVRGDGRSLRLAIGNGIEAPVARNSVAMLRDAGWLDDGA